MGWWLASKNLAMPDITALETQVCCPARNVAISDAPIPLFTNRSDTDTFYFKTSRYLANTDILP